MLHCASMSVLCATQYCMHVGICYTHTQIKCSQYWPNGESQTCADITVTFKSATNNADFVVRTFEVKRVSI